MFQRGQKIIIIESSANKKAHPKMGDVGYLDNMYLFVHDRFILLDAFFFKYNIDNKYNKDRVEKKRFIIDLGMKNNLKLNINDGVPIKFFVNKDHINLTSTGYATKTLDYVEILIEYPLVHSNYGVWNSVRKPIKDGFLSIHSSKELYKIPYGHIALFSSKHNSKYKIENKNDNEFIAWIKSMMPAISSMHRIFHDYTEGIRYIQGKNCFKEVVDNCFVKADIKSSSIAKYTKYLYTNSVKHNILVHRALSDDGKYMTAGHYLSMDIGKLNRQGKSTIVKDINFISVLNNIFIRRLDAYYINRFNQKEYAEIRGYIRHMWDTKGISDKSDIITEIMPVINIIRSILYRAIVMKCNTNEKIGPIQLNYLPTSWRNAFGDKIDSANRMKLEADHSSSALNRIYDII